MNTINATLYDKLNFNFIRDIAPVATLSRGLHMPPGTPNSFLTPAWLRRCRIYCSALTMAGCAAASVTTALAWR
jgi:hypothetical protein